MTYREARAAIRRIVRQTSYARVGAGIGLHRKGKQPFLHSQVRAWVVGEKVPSEATAKAIEAWSKGAIPVDAWRRA